MITIRIPNNNINERRYILNTLLNDFLGLKYTCIIDNNVHDWRLILCNGSTVIFNDAFFDNFKNDLSYISTTSIPVNVKFAYNKFMNAMDMPILFGDDDLKIFESKIYCGIDIFASCFFMLTRWEEFVNKERDIHDRFMATSSLAYRFDFLHRPIVNEYVEMLKNMVYFLDNNIVFKKHEFKKYITCDVDEPFDTTVKNCKSVIRTCIGDVIKRKNLIQCLKRIVTYFSNRIGYYGFDKNYIFEWYMNVCEKSALKVSFYFIPDNNEDNNGSYGLHEKRIQNLIKYIASRGHEIGVHGAYQTYNSRYIMLEHKKKLEKLLKILGIIQNGLGNRQHYLRWDSSVTPTILDDVGFRYDTTGSYADYAGFRYGCCYEFRMFDFLNRKTLTIKQRPLIVMECSVFDKRYMGLDYIKGYEFVLNMIRVCKKHGGNFVLLWHNSNFENSIQKKMFVDIINFLGKV